MLIKRRLYSVMDEEGNLGYYLYDEATGEEKLFSVVEEEKLFRDPFEGFKKGFKKENKRLRRLEHLEKAGSSGKNISDAALLKDSRTFFGGKHMDRIKSVYETGNNKINSFDPLLINSNKTARLNKLKAFKAKKSMMGGSKVANKINFGNKAKALVRAGNMSKAAKIGGAAVLGLGALAGGAQLMMD